MNPDADKQKQENEILKAGTKQRQKETINTKETVRKLN